MGDSFSHHVFMVSTMHCDDCATLINETLRALPGIHEAHATAATRTITIDFDPRQTSPEMAARTITELGFRVKPPRADEPTHQQPVQPQVSEAAWRLLEPILHAHGGQVRDLRRIFEGIAYKHRQNVPWRAVPATFGPWQTLYARCTRWRADGTWTKLATEANRRDDLAGELAWLASASS